MDKLFPRSQSWKPHNPSEADILGNSATRSDPEVFPLYVAAKKTANVEHAERYIDKMLATESGQKGLRSLLAKCEGKTPILLPVAALEQVVEGQNSYEFNVIPSVLAGRIHQMTGWEIDDGNILQANKAGRTRVEDADKFVKQAHFTGPVEKDRDYVILDDHFANGGTAKNLMDYIESNGGRVIAVGSLTCGKNAGHLKPSEKAVSRITQMVGSGEFSKFHNEVFGMGSGSCEFKRGGRDLDQCLFTHGELAYVTEACRQGGIDGLRGALEGAAARQRADTGRAGEAPGENAGHSAEIHRGRDEAGERGVRHTGKVGFDDSQLAAIQKVLENAGLQGGVGKLLSTPAIDPGSREIVR